METPSPAKARPDISLILPTYKRPDMLAAALGSIGKSAGCRRDDVEIIVVDNSREREAETVVLKASGDFLFPLHYRHEPRSGPSFARNTGVADAAGTYVVFMDDDQQIDSSYLSRVVPCFEKTRADCIGGWVGYVDAEQFPCWLKTLVARMGTRDLGAVPREIGANDPKLGAGNMAMRKSVFESVGGFRTDLKQAEDLELQERVLKAGGRIHYEPDLRQYHYLEPQRRTRGYYLRRSFEAGRAECRIEEQKWRSAPRLLGAPRFLWKKIANDIGRALAPSSFRPETMMDRWCDVAARLGWLYEARGNSSNVIRQSITP